MMAGWAGVDTLAGHNLSFSLCEGDVSILLVPAEVQ